MNKTLFVYFVTIVNYWSIVTGATNYSVSTENKKTLGAFGVNYRIW